MGKLIRNVVMKTREDDLLAEWEEDLYVRTEPVDARKVHFKVHARDTYLKQDCAVEFEAWVRWTTRAGVKVEGWVKYTCMAREGFIFDFNSSFGIRSYDRHVGGPLWHDWLHVAQPWGIGLGHANALYNELLRLSGAANPEGREGFATKVWRWVKFAAVWSYFGRAAWRRNRRRKDKLEWLAENGLPAGGQYKAEYEGRILARRWPGVAIFHGPRVGW